MRPRLLALLENRDRNLPQPLLDVRPLLEQLPEPNRTRETAWPGADDENPDLDPLVGRVGRDRHDVGRAEGGREVERASHL